MFYDKMDSRSEGIIFPARAGVIPRMLPRRLHTLYLSRMSGAQFTELSHYEVVCLMRQSVFAA